ncbi:alpha/beta hydrolase [Hymenobacter wooponensis]|uniref:Alpha/beta hydrolase n=1 Tax=Hymenobacter wooponensis TaxID=1525360 RepID=A0A4Z0MDU2_9BACT|nr:alpha/beta hydrolase-fold protein [Hymenobacter wooponensis]TGD77686.1 alpha/beta hydrolase [Hymenobacter wooponensis]
MNQLLLFLSGILVCFHSAAQPGNQTILGHTDSLRSTILQESRKFYVHVPAGAAGQRAATQRYPVVYLFDADAQFAAATSMVQYLSTNYNAVCPQMIVVGLLHPDRRKDLTPTHVATDPPFWAAGASRTSGGGEPFIAFLEQELMPYIDRHYPTQPRKLLIGHSLGGLAVMQIFVHHTRLFDSYICLDPSMWWDNQTLLQETKRALETRRFPGTSFYLGIAHTAAEGLDIPTVLADTTPATLHMRSGLTLQRYFELNPHNGLKYQGKYYPNESHMSVPFIAEYDALRFLFDTGRK